MRFAVVIAAMLLIACGEVESGALSRGSPVPAATPTPDIALRLMDRVTKMTAIVRRVDRIATVQAKWGDIAARRGMPQSGADPNEDVWVIAVVGEINRGIARTGDGGYPCGVFVYDAAGTWKSSTDSALSGCAPYFADSLVPPSAPIACGPEPLGYRYPGGSPTTPGPVRLTIARDDTWRMPTAAPGSFLYEMPQGSGGYYETYCRMENVIAVPAPFDLKKLAGLGSPTLAGPLPAGEAQLWLKNFHALEATAGSDNVKVVVEPRSGFEIVSFDWRLVAPQGGYVTFQFVDRAGREVLPFRVANGP